MVGRVGRELRRADGVPPTIIIHTTTSLDGQTFYTCILSFNCKLDRNAWYNQGRKKHILSKPSMFWSDTLLRRELERRPRDSYGVTSNN